jgi:hypothetical protein
MWIILGLSLAGFEAGAQDLSAFLEEQMPEQEELVTATFKSTRVAAGHSIERAEEGELDFRITHRFGPVNSGAYEFWGLDVAHIHLGLEYGITDWLMIGVGRSTFEKTVDGFVKFSVLRQSKGSRPVPVSLSWLSGVYVNGLRFDDPEELYDFGHRLSYAHQIFVARKFNERLSLQLMPSYLHQNLVEGSGDPNDLFGLGAAGRMKLSKRVAFNVEYYHMFFPGGADMSMELYSPLSLGIDIETGGHVFQIVLTNTIGMRENAFLGHTTGSWLDGDIHLGFNVSRVFQLKK